MNRHIPEGGTTGNPSHRAIMMQDYQIKLDIFEGPLDLLLYLVEKDELDIQCIQVSRVCVQFLEYLEMIKELNIEMAGEYLVMAATLIRLKAQELLPPSETAQTGEEGEIINREQLIAQLEQYKKFKEAAASLRRFENDQWGTYYKAEPEKVEWADEYQEQTIEAGVFDLLSAFKRVLEQAQRELTHDVVRPVIHIDDRIEYIVGLLLDQPQVRFEDLFIESRSRIMIVATFMALLELVKMEQVRLRQQEQFGQIWIHRREPETTSTASQPADAALEQDTAPSVSKPADAPGI